MAHSIGFGPGVPAYGRPPSPSDEDNALAAPEWTVPAPLATVLSVLAVALGAAAALLF